MRTRLVAAALAAAALLTVTACSSSDSSEAKPTATTATPATPRTTVPVPTTPTTPPPTSPSSEQAALEQAVRAYSEAYFKPDATAAYAMLSARCQQQIDATMYGSVIEQAAKDYGTQAIKTLTVDQLAGDLARVTYTYDVPKLNQAGQPWAREGGQWRYDAC